MRWSTSVRPHVLTSKGYGLWTKSIRVINPGFAVADAEDVTFSFNGQNVYVQFTDWRARPVHLVFENAIGLRWQDSDTHDDNRGQFDSVHLVEHSQWLMHVNERDCTEDGLQLLHYVLNFNEVGTLDVLCSELRMVEPDDAD